MSAESIQWRWDLPDEHYIDVKPEGTCKNRYCPSGGVVHTHLTRGYCDPCASIRKKTAPIEVESYLKFLGIYD